MLDFLNAKLAEYAEKKLYILCASAFDNLTLNL